MKKDKKINKKAGSKFLGMKDPANAINNDLLKYI